MPTIMEIPTTKSTRKYTQDDIKKFKRQGVLVPKSATSPDETDTLRSALFPDGIVVAPKDRSTILQIFEATVQKFGDRPFLGHRTRAVDASGNVTFGAYAWQTYNDVAASVRRTGAGLHRLLGSPRESRRVGIYSVNRPEWIISEYGAFAYSHIAVALYDTLGANAIEFIVKHAELGLVFCSADKIPILLKVAKRCPGLRTIVSLDVLSATAGSAGAVLRAWAAEAGVTLLDLAQLQASGQAALDSTPPRPPTAESVAVISYTSGTTGDPKGVLQTHGNVATVVFAATQQGIVFNENDVYISYLPLAHVFEHSVFTIVMSDGVSAGYWRGDVALLVEDMQTLRPTVFPSVPRLFNRIHAKVLQSTVESGSALKAALFQRALSSKLSSLEQGSVTSFLWDRLVFSKVRAVLGGRVRFMVSASAPISPEVVQFMRVAFCTELIEAYGQTEGTGACNVTWPGCYDTGIVGPPICCCEVKLVSAPEMGYAVTDKPHPRGEICVRGPSIFSGYFKDAAKTAETFLPGGWMRSGDIGTLDERGRISVIDRRKNIFKLSQGEYVAPEKLENTYGKCPFVAQIFVHGESLQNMLVAVVVPNAEHVIPWAKRRGLLPASVPDPAPTDVNPPGLRELCASAEFRAQVLAQLATLARDARLQGFEYVRAVHLETEPFSVDNNLLTPTFKLKRADAHRRFRSEIAALYEELQRGQSIAKDAAKL